MKNQKVFWNTKRLYTEHGQRMGAYWDGTHIHYVDVDRLCNGSVKCSNVDHAYQLEERAMAAYDNNMGDRHVLLNCQDRDAFEAEVKENAPSLIKEV